MSGKSGLHVRVAALALLVILLAGVPRAGVGKCLGADRARAARLFEYLFFLMEEKLTAGEFRVRDLMTKLKGFTLRLIPILSMEMIQLESRWTVRRVLTEADFSTGKLAEALRSHLDRAKLVLSYTGDSIELYPEDVRWITTMTAGTFMVCRAIRQKSPEVCTALDPPGRGGMRSECESLAVRAGILYRNDCSEESVGKTASVFKAQPGVIMTFCLAIRDKKPLQCASIADISPEAFATCRALAGHGETACQDPALSKETTQECQKSLLFQGVLTGRIPLEAIPDDLKKQDLLWPALQALSSEKACDELALDAYDEMVASLGLFTHRF